MFSLSSSKAVYKESGLLCSRYCNHIQIRTITYYTRERCFFLCTFSCSLSSRSWTVCFIGSWTLCGQFQMNLIRVHFCIHIMATSPSPTGFSNPNSQQLISLYPNTFADHMTSVRHRWSFTLLIVAEIHWDSAETTHVELFFSCRNFWDLKNICFFN